MEAPLAEGLTTHIDVRAFLIQAFASHPSAASSEQQLPLAHIRRHPSHPCAPPGHTERLLLLPPLCSSATCAAMHRSECMKATACKLCCHDTGAGPRTLTVCCAVRM